MDFPKSLDLVEDRETVSGTISLRLQPLSRNFRNKSRSNLPRPSSAHGFRGKPYTSYTGPWFLLHQRRRLAHTDSLGALVEAEERISIRQQRPLLWKLWKIDVVNGGKSRILHEAYFNPIGCPALDAFEFAPDTNQEAKEHCTCKLLSNNTGGALQDGYRVYRMGLVENDMNGSFTVLRPHLRILISSLM